MVAEFPCRCGAVFPTVKARAGHASGRPQCVLPREERLRRGRESSERARRAAGVRPMRPLADRFEDKVDRSGGPDACWPWTGVRTDRGYGQIWVDGGHRPATHVALELAGVDIPDGMVACHHCDNPMCVNPAHLFVGTASDNMRDMLAKGRGRWQRAS